jgi:hypothetical protein
MTHEPCQDYKAKEQGCGHNQQGKPKLVPSAGLANAFYKLKRGEFMVRVGHG